MPIVIRFGKVGHVFLDEEISLDHFVRVVFMIGFIYALNNLEQEINRIKGEMMYNRTLFSSFKPVVRCCYLGEYLSEQERDEKFIEREASFVEDEWESIYIRILSD